MSPLLDLHLYTADTPNGQKISIALEELKVPYRQTILDLNLGEQKAPSFLALNPNGKIPVLVDPQCDKVLFESAVILTYLSEKYSELGGGLASERLQTQQWLCFQIASVGPMLGQLWWFRHGTDQINDQALKRYTHESLRLYGVVEAQLNNHSYIAGEGYTIADIALFPWLRTYEELGLDISRFRATHAWLDRIDARPAVIAGLNRSRQGS